MTINVEISTPIGQITGVLFDENAPATVAAFLAYLDAGVFENTSFFRIVSLDHPQKGAAAKIAVIQGGPEFDRRGHDPARQLFDMPHEPTEFTGIHHLDGTLGMGRFAPGESYGGFYICVGPQPELDAGGARFPDGQGGAAFGRISQGMDVVRAIYAMAGAGEFIEKPVPILSVRRL